MPLGTNLLSLVTDERCTDSLVKHIKNWHTQSSESYPTSTHLYFNLLQINYILNTFSCLGYQCLCISMFVVVWILTVTQMLFYLCVYIVCLWLCECCQWHKCCFTSVCTNWQRSVLVCGIQTTRSPHWDEHKYTAHTDRGNLNNKLISVCTSINRPRWHSGYVIG